jgi:hypothetical protein
MTQWKDNPEANAKLKAAVQEGVNAYLLILSRALREQLSKPGTGRAYRVNQGRGRRARNLRESGFHRASRAGSPPAADTGMLRRSWQLGRTRLRGAVHPSDTGGKAGADGGGMSTGRATSRRGTKVVSSTLGILNTNDRIGYRFGSAVKYARIEFGYGRTAPRPYIRPTLNAIRDLFAPTMAAALKRNLGGGRR